MSPRNFARVFAREVGMTPGDSSRTRASKRRAAASRNPPRRRLGRAACGFGTRESMRRAFIRTLRVRPAHTAAALIKN